MKVTHFMEESGRKFVNVRKLLQAFAAQLLLTNKFNKLFNYYLKC